MGIQEKLKEYVLVCAKHGGSWVTALNGLPSKVQEAVVGMHDLVLTLQTRAYFKAERTAAAIGQAYLARTGVSLSKTIYEIDATKSFQAQAEDAVALLWRPAIQVLNRKAVQEALSKAAITSEAVKSVRKRWQGPQTAAAQ